MWTDVIGLAQTPDAGSNAAVEAHIKVPGRVGGAGVNVGVRRRRGADAEEDAVARPTEALVALARIQAARGAIVAGDRGVCRRCGFAGHLASQCKSEYVMLPTTTTRAHSWRSATRPEPKATAGASGDERRRRRSARRATRGGRDERRRRERERRRGNGGDATRRPTPTPTRIRRRRSRRPRALRPRRRRSVAHTVWWIDSCGG